MAIACPGDVHAQRQPAIARLLAENRRDVGDHPGQVHGLAADLHPAAFDPRQVEQRIEHLRGRVHAFAQVGQGRIQRAVAVAA